MLLSSHPQSCDFRWHSALYLASVFSSIKWDDDLAPTSKLGDQMKEVGEGKGILGGSGCVFSRWPVAQGAYTRTHGT